MRTIAIIGILVIAIAAATPPVKPRAPQRVKYSTIKSILQKNCVPCHSGTKPAHELDLSTYAKVLKGDKEGKVAIPRNPSASRLIKAVLGSGATPMPPGRRITVQQIGALKGWIQSGCPND